jgi:hypothetical protein
MKKKGYMMILLHQGLQQFPCTIGHYRISFRGSQKGIHKGTHNGTGHPIDICGH